MIRSWLNSAWGLATQSVLRRSRVNPFARSGHPPENPRYWHAGIADPIQAARIEAAAVKRARKAEKLYRDARYSGSQNYSLSHIQIK